MAGPPSPSKASPVEKLPAPATVEILPSVPDLANAMVSAIGKEDIAGGIDDGRPRFDKQRRSGRAAIEAASGGSGAREVRNGSVGRHAAQAVAARIGNDQAALPIQRDAVRKQKKKAFTAAVPSGTVR